MKIRCLFLLLAILCKSHFGFSSGKEIFLKEGSTFEPLDSNIWDFRYVDEQHKSLAKDIRDPSFDNSPNASVNVGGGIYYHNKGVYDASIVINNQSSKKDFYLEARRPFFSAINIVFLQKNADGIENITSSAQWNPTTNGTDLIGSSLFVPISIPSGQSRMVIRASPTFNMVTYVLQSKGHAVDIAWQQWLLGPCSYAAIIALIVYAALTGFILRSRAHLYYIFYAVSFLLTNSIMNGWFDTLMRALGVNASLRELFQNIAACVFANLIPVGLSLFLIDFLDLKEKSPRWYLTLKGFAAVSFFAFILTITLMPGNLDRGLFFVQLARTLGTATTIIPLCLIIYMAFKQSRQARFAMPAIFTLMCSSFVWVLTIDLEIYRPMVQIYAGTIGMVGEMTLLSLALSDKIQTTLKLQNIAVNTLKDQLQFMNESLHATVRERTRDIRSILDSVSQGLLPIESLPGGDFGISPIHSRSLNQILGEKAMQSFDPFHDFLRATNLSLEAQSLIDTTIVTSLGEDHMQFAVNVHLLPTSTTLVRGDENRSLDLEWQPILSDDSMVKKVLLVIDDVTEKKALEVGHKEKSALINVIVQSLALSDRQYSDFIHYADIHFKEASIVLNGQIASELALSSAMRPLHTLKGLARNYGFASLSSIIHNAETDLALLRGHSSDHHQWMVILQTVGSEIVTIKQVNEATFKRGISGDSTLSLPTETLKNWAERIMAPNQLHDLNLLVREIQSLYLKTLPQIIEADLFALAGIARTLGKLEPFVTFSGDSEFIGSEYHVALKESFVHLLRNAMDHGIEHPEERRLRHKPEAGTIHIKEQHLAKVVVISISDDGLGIDTHQIGRKALEKHLIDYDALARLSHAWCKPAPFCFWFFYQIHRH